MQQTSYLFSHLRFETPASSILPMLDFIMRLLFFPVIRTYFITYTVGNNPSQLPPHLKPHHTKFHTTSLQRTQSHSSNVTSVRNILHIKTHLRPTANKLSTFDTISLYVVSFVKKNPTPTSLATRLQPTKRAMTSPIPPISSPSKTHYTSNPTSNLPPVGSQH